MEAIINETTTMINRESLPMLSSVKDSAKLGISKTTYYRLTHMADLPVVIIGSRRFLHRDRFFAWLDQVAEIPN
jgi:hypothetical protein